MPKLMRWTLQLLVGLLVAMPAAAQTADRTAALERVLADAEILRFEAQDVRWMLDTKSPNYTIIRQQVLGLEIHVAALNRSIADYEMDGIPLTPDARVAFERARTASDTLGSLIAEGVASLARAEATASDRKMLRAQAESIAARAEIVRDEIGRLRG